METGPFVEASGAMLALGFALALGLLFASSILLGFVALVRRLLG